MNWKLRIQLTLGSGLGVIQGQCPLPLWVTQGQWPPLFVVLFEAPSHPVAQAGLTLPSTGYEPPSLLYCRLIVITVGPVSSSALSRAVKPYIPRVGSTELQGLALQHGHLP